MSMLHHLRREPSSILWLRPTSGWRYLDLRAIWTYRDLLLHFAWRDIQVRYRQTVIGIFWILIHPIVQMAIFAIIFGQIAGLPSQGIPYAVFVYCGLLPWTYFSSTVAKMTNSLDGNMNLVTKVYFPRAVLPISVMVGTLVDFCVSLPVLLVMALIFQVPLGPTLIALPIVMLVLLMVTLGVGLWLAALNARYRDAGLAVPLLLQVSFYLTPVVYDSEILAKVVPADLQIFLALLNPMFGVVEAFRWAALGVGALRLDQLALSCLVGTVLVLGGGLYFHRTERTLVDRI